MNKQKHAGNVLIKKDNISVIECNTCGFKHIQPLPTVKELVDLYKEDFYSEDKPSYFKDNKEDFPWWKATYDNYYSNLEENVAGRKILDVGSGPGDFLKCGKDRGWDVLGIEPSKAASEYSKKRELPIINDFFKYDLVKERGPFDVVHASLVLEHVPDPISFIHDMKKVLKHGGLLAIYSPNDFNALQDILIKNLKFEPWWVVPEHHLNYFDVSSMNKVLSHAGFEVIKVIGTFPMEYFLLSGSNYVGNAEVGRKCQETRKLFEMNMYMSKRGTEVLNSLYSQLIENNIGRSFFMIAKAK